MTTSANDPSTLAMTPAARTPGRKPTENAAMQEMTQQRIDTRYAGNGESTEASMAPPDDGIRSFGIAARLEEDMRELWLLIREAKRLMSPRTGAAAWRKVAIAVATACQVIAHRLPRLRRLAKACYVVPAGVHPATEASWGTILPLITKLATEVTRATDPGAAAAYTLTSLRKHIEYNFDLIYGRHLMPSLTRPSGCRDHDELLAWLWGNECDFAS